MSRFLKVNFNGEIYDLACQQYSVGLYVCLYQNGRMVDQFGSSLSEDEFVKSIEDKIVKD